MARSGLRRGRWARRYNPRIDILLVCTGNICRSPMAEGVLRARLEEHGVEASVSSTGTTFVDRPASDHAVSSMRRRGIDIAGHRSRIIDREQIAAADLVIAMARSHVREAMLLDPAAFSRIFTLKELVRRGELIGPRLPDESEQQWLRRAGLGRRPVDHVGYSVDDDVLDPFGQEASAYEGTAREIADLLGRLVVLLWPTGTAGAAVRVTLKESEART